MAHVTGSREDPKIKAAFEAWLKPLIGSYFSYDLTFVTEGAYYKHSQVQSLFMAFRAGYTAPHA